MGAAGTDVAIEAAHIALMRDDWTLVPEVFRIARRTMRVVKMNLSFTILYNLVGLILAAFGILPPILAAAAQQAVREWRFKPVVQNGQAVETKAKITVNFNIKVAGNSETTIAESRPVPIESLMR